MNKKMITLTITTLLSLIILLIAIIYFISNKPSINVEDTPPTNNVDTNVEASKPEPPVDSNKEDFIDNVSDNPNVYVPAENPNPENGLLPMELEQKLPELGFVFSDGESNSTMRKYVLDHTDVDIGQYNKLLTLHLYNLTESNINEVKVILSLILPTSHDEVFNILSGFYDTDFSTIKEQTLIRDSKILEFYNDTYGPYVVINY